MPETRPMVFVTVHAMAREATDARSAAGVVARVDHAQTDTAAQGPIRRGMKR